MARRSRRADRPRSNPRCVVAVANVSETTATATAVLVMYGENPSVMLQTLDENYPSETAARSVTEMGSFAYLGSALTPPPSRPSWRRGGACGGEFSSVYHRDDGVEWERVKPREFEFGKSDGNWRLALARKCAVVFGTDVEYAYVFEEGAWGVTLVPSGEDLTVEARAKLSERTRA